MIFIIFNFKRNLFPWFIKESRKMVIRIAVATAIGAKMLNILIFKNIDIIMITLLICDRLPFSSAMP